ncbi:Uncharacterized protein GBIM_00542, partial [Gryllus bimaculatus]
QILCPFDTSSVIVLTGLKTIINALLHSFRQLAEVMTLTIFCLMVFALFALQVYMGELRNKCVRRWDPANISANWSDWVQDESNWLRNDQNESVICGNTTGARHCSAEYMCIQVGGNPNHGYTNFDNFLWSMLTTFQLITLDYWENVYNMIITHFLYYHINIEQNFLKRSVFSRESLIFTYNMECQEKKLQLKQYLKK